MTKPDLSQILADIKKLDLSQMLDDIKQYENNVIGLQKPFSNILDNIDVYKFTISSVTLESYNDTCCNGTITIAAFDSIKVQLSWVWKFINNNYPTVDFTSGVSVGELELGKIPRGMVMEIIFNFLDWKDAIITCVLEFQQPTNKQDSAITITQNDGPTICFTGRLLMKVGDHATTLDVYQTIGDKMICVTTIDLLKHTSAQVVDSIDQIPNIFGFSPLAKTLYQKLNIDTTVRVL